MAKYDVSATGEAPLYGRAIVEAENLEDAQDLAADLEWWQFEWTPNSCGGDITVDSVEEE